MQIDGQLLADAEAFAAEHDRSLDSVVEDALRLMPHRAKEAAERPKIDLPVCGGEAGLPGVELTPEYLKELLLEEDIERLLKVQRDEAARRQRTDQDLP
ncbi:hypothetical protein [Actinoallomurus sp. NPDC050550]|uniref:hypothetical protein n=1 Tax=Actinoallomurus sp. NPDC050550 TaxID=3154937 RepID=UPI0033D0CBBD